jgi:hypothetical protein
MPAKHTPFPAAFLELPLVGVIALGLFVTGFFNLRGTAWLVGFLGAINLANMGVLTLFFAKWPLYRSGKLLSWGSRGLPDAQRRRYRIGVWLSAIGCGAAALMVAQSFLWR